MFAGVAFLVGHSLKLGVLQPDCAVGASGKIKKLGYDLGLVAG